ATPVDVEYEQDDKECGMNRRSPSLDLLPPSCSRSSVRPIKKKPLVSNPFSSSPTRHPAQYNVGKTMSPVKGLNYTPRDRMAHSSVLRRGLFGINRQAPSGHRGSSGRAVASSSFKQPKSRSSSVASIRSDHSDATMMSVTESSTTVKGGSRYKKKSDLKELPIEDVYRETR